MNKNTMYKIYWIQKHASNEFYVYITINSAKTFNKWHYFL